MEVGSRKRRRWALAGPLLVLGAIAALSWWAFRDAPPPTPPPARTESPRFADRAPLPAATARDHSNGTEKRPGDLPGAETSIAGWVRYSDGGAVNSARVHFRSVEAVDARAAGTRRSCRVERGGAFRVEGLTLGSYVVTLTRQSWGRYEEHGPWTVQCGTREVALTLDGPSPRSFLLRLLTTGNEPVSHAILVIHGEQARRQSVLGGVIDVPILVESERIWVEVRVAFQNVSPIATGLFGPYLTDGSDIDLHIGPELTISGHVEDAQGERESGVSVSAAPMADDVKAASVETTTTGDDGCFVLAGLGAGEYRVTVSRSNAGLSQSIRARGGAEGLVIRLGSGITSRVRLVDPQGRPVAGARVQVRGDTISMAAATDADGVATLENLDPRQRYRLTLRPPPGRLDLSEFPVEGFSPGDTELSFPSIASVPSLLVRVRGRAGPGGAMEASLTCDETGEVVRSRTERRGSESFVYTGLDPNEVYTFRVAIPEDGVAGVRRGVRLCDGEVTVELVPGGRIRGRIRGGSSGGDVVLCQGHGISTWTRSQEDGSFEVAGLPPGWWEVTSLPRKGRRVRSGRTRVEVSLGETVDVEIEQK